MKKVLLLLFVSLLATLLGCQNNQNTVEGDYETLFHDGLLGICNNNYCGYINEEFEETIVFEYSYVRDFQNGLAVVDKGGYEGVIDKEGNVIIPFTYDYVFIDHDSEAIRAVKNFLYEFFDLNGEELTFTEYYTNKGFGSDDLIAYNDHSDNTYGDASYNRYGFKDIDGNLVIDCQYDDVVGESFTDSILVNRDGKFYLLDKDGTESEYLGFNRLYVTNYEGYYSISIRGSKWGLANSQGEIIIPMDYDYPIILNEQGVAVIERSGDYGLIDYEGTILLQPHYNLYDSHRKYELHKDNFIIFYNDTKYFLYDSEGSKVVESDDQIMAANEDYVIYRSKEDYKYSLYDYEDNLLIGPTSYIYLDYDGQEYIYVEDIESRSLEIYDGKLNKISSSLNNSIYDSFINNYSNKDFFAVFNTASNKIDLYDETFTMIYSTEFSDNFDIYNDGYIVVDLGDSILIMDHQGNQLLNSTTYVFRK